MPLSVRFLIKRNRVALAFIGKFILFYLIGQAAYLFFRSDISPIMTEKMTAAVSAHLINILAPGEHVITNGPVLSGKISLTIAMGCDGIEGLVLIIAALCAFPMPTSRKWAGIGVGTAVIYFANLVRVVALYFVIRLYPSAFSFAHMYAGQVFTIFVGLLFFLSWVRRSAINHEAAC